MEKYLAGIAVGYLSESRGNIPDNNAGIFDIQIIYFVA
jgi:hypothetical protein